MRLTRLSLLPRRITAQGARGRPRRLRAPRHGRTPCDGTRRDHLQRILRAVIIDVAGLLPERDLTNAWELVDAGEPGIALENLCTQLYEYDVVLDPAVREQVRELAIAMEMDAERLLEGLTS